MKLFIRNLLLVSLVLISSGCVNVSAPLAKSEARSITLIPSAHALDEIEIGKTTKEEVLAKFGKTRSVSFDSGFEVWAYQYKYDGISKTGFVQWVEHLGSRKGVLGNVEVVILIDPQGIVSKKRIRLPTSDDKDKNRSG